MRVGKFKIENRFLNSKRIDNKFYVQMALSKVFITDQRKDPVNKCTNFKGICDEFDDIKDGDEVPEYTVEIHKKENKVTFTRIQL